MVLILWTFVIFSFLGWVGNVIRNLAVYKRFKNNGFLTSPFFPMYGLTAVICRVVLTPLANYPWLLLAASIALTTAVIVLSEFLFEKILGFKYGIIRSQNLASAVIYLCLMHCWQDFSDLVL